MVFVSFKSYFAKQTLTNIDLSAFVLTLCQFVQTFLEDSQECLQLYLLDYYLYFSDFLWMILVGFKSI